MNIQFIEHVATDLFNPAVTLLWLQIFFYKKSSLSNWKQHVAATLSAVALNYILSHINRWLGLWQAEPYFPSGHMSYAVTLATSIFFLKPVVFFILLPALAGYGWLIVTLNFHTWLDLAGAFVMATPLTCLCHYYASRKTAPKKSDVATT